MRDTRIAIDDILEALASGWNVGEAAENHRIPVKAVYEALRHATEVQGRSR